ncbi:MAG: toprim domain-containing protein [Pseudomonadales bacterium]|nr:toprim domain-containing protein [Pseudomonadales bacterium]
MSRYNVNDVRCLAFGNWGVIIPALCPPLIPAFEKMGRHVPCPFHGGKDGFRLFNDFLETGGGYCNTCGPFADGFSLVMEGNRCTFPEALKAVGDYLQCGTSPIETVRRTPPKKKEEVNEKARKALGKAFKESHPIINPKLDALPVARYFGNRDLYGAIKNPPVNLRFHPSLEYYDEHGKLLGSYPCILAPIVNPEGQMVSLHRTFLTNHGNKANVPSPKKLMVSMVSGITRGGAIRLYDATDCLAVAEGIETAIAVHLATEWPVWACVSAGMLEKVDIPEKVKILHIMADKDRSGTGLKSANVLANRYLHLDVKILLPPQIIPDDQKSIDWCDTLTSIKEVG